VKLTIFFFLKKKNEKLICAIPAFLETCKTEKGVIFDKLRKVCGDEKDAYNSFKDLCLKLNAPWPGQQDAYGFLNSFLMAVEDELQRRLDFDHLFVN